MARAQDGDAAAYLRLLEEITPYLRSRTARYLRDPGDIEDTVQDILLTLHLVRQTYDPSRPFGPWLVGIANRRAFDRLRREGRRRLHEVPLASEHDTVAAADPIDSSADRRHLEGAIGELPPAQQQAIRMLKLKEMSLKEPATASGMSIASLKVATHRALKNLRNMLLDRGESDEHHRPHPLARRQRDPRLRPPLLRAGLWLLLAAVIIGLLTVSHGLSPRFAERMQDVTFVTGMFASLLTGVLAAIATFMLSLPDRSRLWLLLPSPPLIVWLSNIGYQCFAGWVSLPPGAVTVEAASSCVATLVLTSLPLSLVMLAMLRYAALLRPISVILMGSLAVSALTSVALSMFHPLDATVMVLGWNLGTAVLFTGLAALFGRRISGRNDRRSASERD
jgi:RNA polymerase sigma factor (sigma-70 family)